MVANSQMPQHPSQTTQETSKQVFMSGKRDNQMPSRNNDGSAIGAELSSIGEDLPSQQKNTTATPINEGLEQDDSIIGND